jgi:hypothetical protein
MTTEEMIESFMLNGGAITVCRPAEYQAAKRGGKRDFRDAQATKHLKKVFRRLR